MTKWQFIRILVGLLAGFLFGAGMVISAMVDPNKVIGFLNISGAWDPSLAFVMGGALMVFVPCYHLIIKKRSQPLLARKFNWTSNTQVDGTLISGAAIFGVGWGLAGFCPGPAVASVGGVSNVILVFILCMIVGIVCANQYLVGRLPLPIVGFRKNVCSIDAKPVEAELGK